MEIGEHEVTFVEKLPADPWFNLWQELVRAVWEGSDDEGRFRPTEVWDWEQQQCFIAAAVDTFDGEPVEGAKDVPAPYWYTLLLAAYNHVSELFLSSQQSLEKKSD